MGNSLTNVGLNCCELAGNDDTAEKVLKKQNSKVKFLEQSLSNVCDINTKYKRGKVLGQGAFGQVI